MRQNPSPLPFFMNMLIVIFACTTQKNFDFIVSNPEDSSVITEDINEQDDNETTEESIENFGDILRLLNTQHSLNQEQLEMAETFMAQKIKSPVYCDEVWRVLLSSEGAILEEPALVWEHASVPDVLILDSGAHLLVYNDLRLDIFMDTLKNNPQRFWKQGLLGYGGVGFSIDRFDGNGFIELTDVDLQFEDLQCAVDPDLGRTLDGTIRLSWFGMTTDVLEDGFISPMQTQKPHRFYRSTWETNWIFTEPVLAVSSFEGSTGGVDPTILTLQDGGEIMFIAPLDYYAMGWFSSDTESWPDNPDVETSIAGATADTLLDQDGVHHMYYMKNGFLGSFELMQSEDGLTWDIGPFEVYFEEGAHNLTVDIDSQGRVWLYYNQLNKDCIDRLEREE